MIDWHYADATNTRQGPLSSADLLRLRQQGLIGEETLLWRDGLADWLPLRELTHELVPDAPAPIVAPASAAAPASESWTLEETTQPDAGAAAWNATPAADAAASDDNGWRPLTEGAGTPHIATASAAGAASASPYAPPVAPVARTTAVVHGGEIVMAGFWKRVAASLIDWLIVSIGSAVVGAVVGGVLGVMLAAGNNFDGAGIVLIQVVANLLGVVVAVAYYAGFHASSMQATLGKMAVGIKVARLDGARIGMGRAIGRYFATILSALIFGIGFLMAAFTQRKQALHDMVCDTLVVDKWAFTEQHALQRPGLDTVTWVILAVFGGLIVLGTLAVIVAIAMAS